MNITEEARSVALATAFLTSGLMEVENGVSRLNPILEAWDNGNIELFDYLGSNVAHAAAALESLVYENSDDGVGGVFHYEVTEEVGAALGSYLLDANRTSAGWSYDDMEVVWQSELLHESHAFINSAVTELCRDKAHKAVDDWSMQHLKRARRPQPAQEQPVFSAHFSVGNVVTLRTGSADIGLFTVNAVAKMESQHLQKDGSVKEEGGLSIVLSGKHRLTPALAEKLTKIGLTPDSLLSEPCLCGECNGGELLLGIEPEALTRMMDCGYIVKG